MFLQNFIIYTKHDNTILSLYIIGTKCFSDFLTNDTRTTISVLGCQINEQRIELAAYPRDSPGTYWSFRSSSRHYNQTMVGQNHNFERDRESGKKHNTTWLLHSKSINNKTTMYKSLLKREAVQEV